MRVKRINGRQGRRRVTLFIPQRRADQQSCAAAYLGGSQGRLPIPDRLGGQELADRVEQIGRDVDGFVGFALEVDTDCEGFLFAVSL